MFNKESYLLGLTDAIELIGDEFDCCKLEFSDENKINTIHSSLSRVISLIEDRMIQHGSDITMNQFVSEFNKSLTLKEK